MAAELIQLQLATIQFRSLQTFVETQELLRTANAKGAGCGLRSPPGVF